MEYYRKFHDCSPNPTLFGSTATNCSQYHMIELQQIQFRRNIIGLGELVEKQFW